MTKFLNFVDTYVAIGISVTTEFMYFANKFHLIENNTQTHTANK